MMMMMMMMMMIDEYSIMNHMSFKKDLRTKIFKKKQHVGRFPLPFLKRAEGAPTTCMQGRVMFKTLEIIHFEWGEHFFSAPAALAKRMLGFVLRSTVRYAEEGLVHWSKGQTPA